MKATCLKCGEESIWTPHYQKSKCYGVHNCGWTDTDIEEHLHMKCGSCGYTRARACNDYKEKKAKKAGWTATDATKPAAKPAARPATIPAAGASFNQGSTGYVTTPAAVQKTGCRIEGCPVTAAAESEATDETPST